MICTFLCQLNCIIWVGGISLSLSFWITCFRAHMVSESLVVDVSFWSHCFHHCVIYLHLYVSTWTSVFWSRLFSCGLFPGKTAHRQASCFPVAFYGKFCTPPQGGWVGTVSSQMDWERLPVAPLYADVRAYCSHVKTYCKRARLLSSHPRLYILSLRSRSITNWKRLRCLFCLSIMVN